MKKTLKKLAQIGVGLFAVLALSLAVVQPTLASGPAACDPDTDPLCLESFSGASRLGDQPLEQTIGGIINVILSLLGIVAVVIVLMGGGKWMFAGGNDEKVGEARKLIISGVIGMAIIMSSWAIARFVLERLAVETDVAGAEYDF